MHLTTNLLIALFGYTLDRIFGEYRFIKHPIIVIGDLISFLEQKLYKNSIVHGGVLVVLTLSIVGGVSFTIERYLSLLHPFFYVAINSFIASIFIAHSMLRESVAVIITLPTLQEQRDAVAMIVSRDTNELSQSDVYKAAIESYAENLSDGVIAPLFYLMLFGVPALILYKTINTLDSMIGYKNERYEKFGKIAARLDDVANFIPSRLTALLIILRAKNLSLRFLRYAKLHESPNAGYPIAAMAQVLGVKLGGNTPYFGKIKKKPYFGEGREIITKEDIEKML